MHMLYRRLIVWIAAVCISLVLTNVASANDRTPPVKTDEDGFPTGHATPEGAATDLIRAYIDRDFRLFNKVRNVSMCEGYNDPANKYVRFLRDTSFSNNSKIFNIDTLPTPLTRISKVFAARSLAPQTEEAKAALEVPWEIHLKIYFLQDRMFVDVVAADSEGREYLHRTEVQKTIAGQWEALTHKAACKMDGPLKTYTLSTVEFSKADKSDKQDAK